MSSKSIMLVGASVAAFALAGCATNNDYVAGKDPYGAMTYAGAERVYGDDIRGALPAPPRQYSENGAEFELVSYAGIEGARRAHQRYSPEEAEALDGKCERFVAPSQTESLLDIANLCDVPLQTLVDYNADVTEISYASGAMLEIPGAPVSPRGSFAMIDALADLYLVGEGESLSSIAEKLNVSESSLMNLNPGLAWSTLAPGQSIKKPAAAAPAASAPSYAPAGPAQSTSAWTGYSGYGLSSSGAGGAIGGQHQPYVLRPTQGAPGGPGAGNPELTVDRAFVKPGGKVRVTAKADPGTEVTFYSGETLDRESVDKDKQRMKEVGRARANDDGEASLDVQVKPNTTAGGVIFKASPEGSNDILYSDRVGVVTVGKKPAKKDAPSEDDSDE